MVGSINCFPILIIDDEVVYYPEIEAVHVMALVSAMREFVQEGSPSDRKERLRWHTIVASLAHITEIHTNALYRWVSQHVDDCDDCRD